MSKRRWTKEEVNEFRKKNDMTFYYNKEDSNFLVPKTYGIGWTFNWANPVSWGLIGVIIGIIIYRKFTG